jgi:5-methyltetrahydropteroyltriglutamate--homocysteine methyltransferase
MPHLPVETTVIGSHPFPAWLEFASAHLDAFGPDDRAELQRDATVIAIQDQVRAGVDVITDGEQGRFDFNLSFYGHLEGIALESAPPRRFGPPAHDQRGKHRITGELRAPRGLGTAAEYERLVELAPAGPALKASVPGPYTLAGRLEPNADHPDRWAITEALIPIVRAELEALVAAGCERITLDEPSMSCYAWREDPERLVDIFNRTVAPVAGRAYLGTHLCFGNYKGHAVGRRLYYEMFTSFIFLDVDELILFIEYVYFSYLVVIDKLADAC